MVQFLPALKMTMDISSCEELSPETRCCPKRVSAPTLTSAFFLGSLPAATDTDRKIDFAAEALPGRWDTGGGRPIRLKSTPSGLPSGVALMVREPFMVDQASPEKETRGAIRHHRARHVVPSSLQHDINQECRCMHVTLVLRRQRWEDQKFKTILR